MISIGRILPSRTSSLVRGLLPLPDSSRIVRNIGSDLLGRRDSSTKFLTYKIFAILQLSKSKIYFSKSRLVRFCSRLLVIPYELCIIYYTHKVISDKIHCLLVTLSYFRPDRFVQLLSLIPILILLFYLLVSIDLVYNGLSELVPEREQLYSKLKSNCSGAETTSSFIT